MSQTPRPVNESLLGRLVPLNALSPSQRRQLGDRSHVLEVAAGQPLDEQWDEAEHTLYLLAGEVELFAGHRRLGHLDGGTEAARFPLSQMGAAQVRARAKTPAQLLRVEQSLVSTLLVWAQAAMDEGQAADADAWMPRLLQSQLFRRIPPANVDKIFTLMKPVRAKAGETIVQQGAPGDYYYVICAGRCAVTRKPSEDRPPVRLAELGPGDTFGEEALLSGATRNASVEMLTDARLMRLTKDDFVQLVQTPMVTRVPPAEAHKLVQNGAVWVDVRLPEEHTHDGIAESINIPLSSVRAHARTLDRSATYVVYSNSGRRSASAAFLMNERGLDARVLEGGLRARHEVPQGAGATQPPGEDGAALQAQLAQANRALEEAFQQKAQTTLKRRVMADQLARVFDHENDTGSPDEQQARERLASELRRLEDESARATDVLKIAQRRKLELEEAMRAADAEAASQRKRAEAAVQRLREQAQARLREEEHHLRDEYARAAAQMDELRRQKQALEADYERQREALETRVSEARSQLEAQARRIREQLERTREQTETKSDRIRGHERDAAEKLRQETEARLRAERQRLESEFAEALEAQQHAQQELERAQAARKRAEEEATKLQRHIDDTLRRRRQQAERRLESERSRVRTQAERAGQRLSQARQAREEAEQALRSTRAKLDRTDQAEQSAAEALRAELRELEAQLNRARGDVDAAEQAWADAEQARYRVEEQAVREQAVEQELRLQLHEETRKWLQNEQAASEAELEKAQRYAQVMEQSAARSVESDTQRHELMAEIEAQLAEASGAEHVGDTTYAEERVSLVRSAHERAGAEMADAQRQLDEANQRIAELREKMRRARYADDD